MIDDLREKMSKATPGPLTHEAGAAALGDTGDYEPFVFIAAGPKAIAHMNNPDEDQAALDAGALVAAYNAAPGLLDRITSLERELAERSMLAAAYRSMALSGETPRDPDVELATVREILDARGTTPTPYRETAAAVLALAAKHLTDASNTVRTIAPLGFPAATLNELTKPWEDTAAVLLAMKNGAR